MKLYDNIKMNKLQNDLYDVNKYTHEELYNILDLTNPTDRELEAKIFFLIHKYENMQNQSGNELANFFKQIYNHFFETSDDEYDEYAEYEEIVEGMTNEAEDIKNNEDYSLYEYSGKNDPNSQIINGNTRLYADMSKENAKRRLDEIDEIRGNNQLNPLKYYNKPNGNVIDLGKEELSDVSRNMGKNAIGFTKPLDYAQDKLNPLLKQTIKRIISIDSQYRDDKTTLSTEFSFNLSEPLKDVVSLKLYSIQIPYTWYTINNNFGSNFIFIKGNSPGIEDVSYQIDISSGNYTPNNLITSINESIQKVKDNNRDISFGSTNISYNTNNSLSTINIDIKNIYNETGYYLEFGNWTNPNYNTNDGYIGNITNREKSIPSFLGFNYKTYYPNVLYSNYLPLKTQDSEIKDSTELNYFVYTEDTGDASKNNYFNIIKYKGNISYNSQLNANIVTEYNGNILNIENIYRINLSLTGPVTRKQIVDDLSNQIANNSFLTQSSIIRSNIISDNNPPIAGNNFSRFNLSLKFDRNTTNNIENSKICVQFPNENNNNNYYNIWTGLGGSSCFNFPSNFNEINNIVSEISPLKQSGNLISVKTNPYIYLSSGEEHYDISTNDYIIPITNSFVGYTINGFITAINDGINNVKDIKNNDVKKDFNLTNSKSYIDNDSKFNLQLDINKTFTNDNYFLDVEGGILKNIFNLSGKYLSAVAGIFTDLSSGRGYTFDSSFTSTIYNIQSDRKILTICPSEKNYGNEKRGNLVVELIGTRQSYNNFGELISDINNSFSTFIDNGSQILNGTEIKYSTKDNSQFVDCSFTINIRKVLTQKNYRIQFCDVSANKDLIKGNLTIERIGTTENYNYNVLLNGVSQPLLGNLITSTGNIYPDGSSYGNLTLDTNGSIFLDNVTNINYPITSIGNIYINGNLQQTLINASIDTNGILELTNGNLTSINGNLTNYDDGCWSKLNIDKKYCGENSYFYDLSKSNITQNTTYTLLKSTDPIKLQEIELKGNNNDNIIYLKPYDIGVKNASGLNDIIIELTKKKYSRDTLIQEINKQLSSNALTNGSYIDIIKNDNIEFTKIRININKIFTSRDYRLVFYDRTSFVKCSAGVKSVRNTTWDTTLGWILGFRNNTIYYLNEYTENNNIITLVGDTTVSVNLFNYFLICLDDFNQNHLNDGLVTLTPKITEIPLPSYANRTKFTCDPVTGLVTYNANDNKNNNHSNLTQNQIYSLTEIANSKRSSSIISYSENSSVQGYGSGPFVKDVFGLIPIKTSGLANGSVYIEFGGTLQNQERTYFGPVNIHRMSIKLVSDRGDTVDLNGSNWSFSLICEQLYQQKPTNGTS